MCSPAGHHQRPGSRAEHRLADGEECDPGGRCGPRGTAVHNPGPGAEHRVADGEECDPGGRCGPRGTAVHNPGPGAEPQLADGEECDPGGGWGPRGTGVHNPGPGEDQRPPCPLAPHSPRWMLPSTRATAAVCCWTAGGGSSASTGLLRILQGREPARGWALQFRYQWPR